MEDMMMEAEAIQANGAVHSDDGTSASSLTRYDAARRALTEAHRVDEVKSIRDKAIAVAAYARQAKDTEMIAMATEIKLRAERRAGELLREMALNGQRARRGGDRKSKSSCNDFDPPDLKDLGISKNDSSVWQQLAEIPEPEFDDLLSAERKEVGSLTTKAVLRLQRRRRDDMPPDAWPEFDLDNIPCDYQCPWCTYAWSGLPKPPTLQDMDASGLVEALVNLVRRWPEAERASFVELAKAAFCNLDGEGAS